MSWSALSAPFQKNTQLQLVLWFLLASVCVAIACSLGFWQLGRAQTKLDWQAQITQKAQMPALDGAALGAQQDTEGKR